MVYRALLWASTDAFVVNKCVTFIGYLSSSGQPPTADTLCMMSPKSVCLGGLVLGLSVSCVFKGIFVCNFLFCLSSWLPGFSPGK